MIRIIGNKLPKDITVACSGGVDSMAIVDFLMRKHNVTLAFYHHGNNDNSDEAHEFVKKFAKNHDLRLIVGYNTDKKIPKKLSLEEYWRIKRYEFLHNIDSEVITGHHLDDCVETWIWSSMNGTGKIIPYRNKNVIRPFLATTKDEFKKWCINKNVAWIEDESNTTDLTKTRNYIRNVVVPNVKVINPGINKTILRKVLEEVK